MFFSFKNVWDIYTQDVKNQAFDQLNLNEWLSFIDEISGTHNFGPIDELAKGALSDENSESDAERSDNMT